MNKRLATVGLGAFLLADIVLVALALRPPPVNTLNAGPTATAAPATASTEEPVEETTSEEPAPTTTASETTAQAGPVPVQRMIVGLDAKIAWRATAGSCSGGGSELQVTTDGGRDWSDAKPPNRALARVQPLRAGTGFVYAAGKDCTPEEWTTRDDGATWDGPKAVAGGWARQLSDTSLVITPADDSARPCGDGVVIDLSRTSAEQAEALCADGSVVVTNDAGAKWSDSGTAPGGVALTNRLDGEVLSTYAARIDPACAGVQVVRVIQGKPAAAVACVQTSALPEPGQVGISATAAAGWLLVGTETWTSGADLTTWKQG